MSDEALPGHTCNLPSCLLMNRATAAEQPPACRRRRRHQQQQQSLQPTIQQPLRLSAAQLNVWQQRLQQPDAAAQLSDNAAAADAAEVLDVMHAVRPARLIESTQAEVAAAVPAAKEERKEDYMYALVLD